MEEWMHGKIMLLSHTLTMKGSDVERLVELSPWFRRRQHDRQMDGQLMQGRTHGKIMLLSHTLTMNGSDVASLVQFCPVV